MVGKIILTSGFSMRLIVLFLSLLSIFSMPLLAQEDVDPNTRAGLARIAENADGTRYLMIGSTRVDLPDNPYLAFLEARRGDLLLVAYSQGGNACPAFFTWVHATPGAIRRSEGFGTCADLVTVTNDAETVRVTMPSFEPGKGDVVFIYDGKSAVREVALGFADSGMAAGDGWDYWVGKYPYDLITAGELQARLTDLMGAADLRQAQEFLSFASPMQAEAGWVVGEGCVKYRCEETAGAVAVNLADGRLAVAVWQKGSEPKIWGNLGGAMPKSLADVMSR